MGRRAVEPWLRWLLAVLMTFAGVMHFVRPEFYVRIMPSLLPRAWDLPLIYASGIFEILGGLGLFWSRTRALAAWGLIAMFIAVFPANIQAALDPTRMDLPAWAAWARLPFQFLLIAWAARYRRAPTPR
jgi:uncharacterized membrane protein